MDKKKTKIKAKRINNFDIFINLLLKAMFIIKIKNTNKVNDLKKEAYLRNSSNPRSLWALVPNGINKSAYEVKSLFCLNKS